MAIASWLWIGFSIIAPLTSIFILSVATYERPHVHAYLFSSLRISDIIEL
jgi:hypothetical protein